MSAGPDRERVTDARHVVDGEGGGDVVKSALYAVYVTILLAVSYGLTVARAVFVSENPRALRGDLLSWPAVGAAVLLAALAVGVAFRAGRSRGPIVPPLPWVDHVVSSPNDRAEALRRWWLLSLLGTVTGGLVVGAVLGGGSWLAQVTGPWFLVGTVVGGLVLGVAVLVAWLSGQASLSGRYATPGRAADASGGARTGFGGLRRPRGGAATVLRGLRTDDLRAQSARSSRIAGGILAGDLRAVRLEVAAPVTRGRGLRLRAARPWLVIVRRDVLGLRRMPGGAAYGVVLSLVGVGAVTWCLDRPEVPLLMPAVAVLPCYLGFGAFAEGLRLLGDNAGTPPLLGIPPRQEATAHLVAPVVAFAVAGLVAAAGTAWADGVSGTRFGLSIAWVVPMCVILAGSHLLSAFRGQPPTSAFRPGTGPTMLLAWLALPAAAAVVVAGLFTWLAAHAAQPWGPLVWALAVAVLLLQIGLIRVRSVSESHRS